MPKLTRAARVYLAVFAVVAVTLIMRTFGTPVRTDAWLLAAVLTASLAVGQLYMLRLPGLNVVYHPGMFFEVLAILMLPLPVVGFVVALGWVPSQLKRPRLEATLFNWSVSVVNAWLVGLIIRAVAPPAAPYLAVAVAILVNAGATAVMVALDAPGQVKRAMTASLPALLFDLGLACMAVIVNALWRISPWHIGLALAALLVLHFSSRLYLQRVQSEMEQIQSLNRQLERTNEQLIEALASVVDARDSLLYGHSAQVAIYAEAIGRELGLAGLELERLRKAALLHDVGKVAVPEAILFKPGALSDDEYSQLKHHAVVGERLVSLIDALQTLSPLVGQHHEAWDGRGYPRALRGDEIELGARVINLCDSLDTILSDRPYKSGKPLEWAVEEVQRCSGRQFDPQVVAAFLRVLEREGPGFFCNSAHATKVGLRRSELFAELRRLGLNVRAGRNPFAEVAAARSE